MNFQSTLRLPLIGVLLHLVTALGFSASVGPVDFAAKIAPLFQEHCVDCHGHDDPDGEFNLESFEALIKGGKAGKAIVPGQAENSLLVKFLEGRSGKEGKNQFMPPGKKEHLKADEIALIRQWIDAGAKPPAADSKPQDLLATLPKIKPTAEVKKAIHAVAVSPKGDLLAVGSFGVVELRDASSREVLRAMGDIAGNVNALAFSPDGMFVFGAAGDAGLSGIVYQWKVADGSLVRRFEGHTDALYALAIAPDGKQFATGGYDQKIKVWSISTGIELKTLKGHNGAVFGLSYRQDGKVLASASADRTVKLWDPSSGARLDTLSQPTKELNTVSFSPDGKTLAAAGADNRLRVWSVSAKALEGSNPILVTTFAHEGAVLKLAYSGDGKTLVSSAADMTVKLWDATNVTERKALPKQADWVQAVAFLPDNRVVLGRLDGSLSVYDSTSGDAISAAVKKTEKPAPKASPTSGTPAKAELIRLEPSGIQAGSTTRVIATGKALQHVQKIVFSDERLKATVVEAAPNGTQVTLDVTAPKELPRAAFDVSFVTDKGETAKLKLYADYLEQRVIKKSDVPVSLDHLPLNLWGTLKETGQHDEFSFHALKGQTITFDLAAKRIGSKAQTLTVELYDSKGQRLGGNGGLDSGSDPFLAFTAPSDMDLVARVSETTLEGSADHTYRLSLGVLPYVTGWWPLSVLPDKESKVHLIGHNLMVDDVIVKAGSSGIVQIPSDSAQYRSRVEMKVTVSDLPELVENEPNDTAATAQTVTLPASINGRLFNQDKADAADVDLYAFQAQAKESWVIETRASMVGSPADTKLEVLDAKGQPVPYLKLQATRDSWINFRSVDSDNPDARLQNWQEMDLDEYVYLQGDIGKIFRLPRGPDSGFLFYSNNGKRRSYFLSSPTAHALDEPAYNVVPLPLDTKPPANGLPVFTVNYSNDDDGERELGKDSRLIFTAPSDGRYLVRVSDSRGWSGERYAYRLIVRPVKPDFSVALSSTAEPSVGASSGVAFSLRSDRQDGFDGDVRVEVSGVPAGFFVSSPLVIEAGHNSVNGCLYALPEARLGKADFSKVKFTASATVAGQKMTKFAQGFTAVTVTAPPKQSLFMEPDLAGKPQGDGKTAPVKPFEITIAPGSTVPAWLRADRKGNEGLINMDVEGLPHGIIVDNIGLNGVQIREKENEREIFLTCSKWVKDQDRLCHIIVGSARNDAKRVGNEQTGFPVLIKVRKDAKVAAMRQQQ